MSKRETGLSGEKQAIEFLKKQGYLILETNFRTKFGELDIVAIDKDTLVFVEVKTRSNHQFGLPEEAVGYHKLNHLVKAAAYFRSNRKSLPLGERIDVIAIETNSGRIEQIKNITS